MISARPAQTPEYYLTPDCPTADGRIEARVGGKAAALMGLTDFKTLEFLRLAKGLNPDTGSKLTARIKADRVDAKDVTMTVPKELSLLIEVLGDERAKDALWNANDYAMGLWEKKAGVRVRKGGVNEDRQTGNMAWYSFYHGTTRPITEAMANFVDQDGTLTFRRGANDNRGTPDPHSHIHNYVPNVSHDKADAKTPWKALKRHHFDLPQIEAAFHKRLAKNLKKLGYEAKVEEKIEVRTRHVKTLGVSHKVKQKVLVSSELVIKGFREEDISLFTRRQDEIKVDERQRAATGQKMTGAYKAKMSQMVRQPKVKTPTITKAELHQEWVDRVPAPRFERMAGVVRKAKASVKARKSSLSRWQEAIAQHASKLRNNVIFHEPEAPERSRNNGRSR